LPIVFCDQAWENRTMKWKKKTKKAISVKIKTTWDSLFSKKKVSPRPTASTSEATQFWHERTALFVALFFFAFGLGLIADGKRIYNQQLKISQRVDYKASLNPNTVN